MPFSLEIDQSFIAAILTVIGFSVNDTVVIFDRIREYRKIYPKRGSLQLMNDSINSTLSRTFSTTFTVFMVLLVIFLFGGEVIRGFVFAMLIGVTTGVYSTLFIAVPVAYEVMKKEKHTTAATEEDVIKE
jgi:SecD/SecF fusion protein